MIVHFGLHFDGMQPTSTRTVVGETVLGPARLLDLLELRLGLPPPRARPAEALLAYQRCLVELDDARRFYHRSFAVDALGVARTLLDWRAQWHEAGWSGRFTSAVSKRLADMAELERLASGRVPLTDGQRLQRIAAALDHGLDAHVDKIVLHDEIDELPVTWQRVLAHLKVESTTRAQTHPTSAHAHAQTPVHTTPTQSPTNARRAEALTESRSARPRGTTGDLFSELASPAAVAPAAVVPDAVAPDVDQGYANDLDRIQQTLLALADDDAGTSHKRQQLSGDASFIVVRAISRDLSAQAIGEHLLKARALDDTVVIAERDGIILDNAFERIGLPRAGFQHYSRFRAVAQVLKLCLGLVWEPISPHLLLQFLIHPVGPLPDHARSTLAEAVAKEPGVGGTAWRAAVDKIAERMRTRFERSEQDTKALIGEIRYWLECERYRPAEGAPLAILIERAQRVTTWLARRLHTATDEHDVDLYAAAEAQGEALVASLAELHDRGGTLMTRIALERLVDEVSGRAADPGTFAQSGHVRATTEPAAVTEPCGTVVWWDLAARTPSLSYPWSAAELDELAREGVALPAVDVRIRNRMRGWLRPIMSARAQLVLVIHDRDQGHHPLWSRIHSLFEGFTEVRIEESLLTDAAELATSALALPTDPLPLAPLPRPRRWWRLPPGVSIPVREQESYSSLNKLIYYPHEWVLGYAARLRRGRAADLSSGNLLNGNLAHRLFEIFFGTHADWARLDARAARAWLADALPRLVGQEGALLCEAGAGVVREQVIATLESAFLALLGHLKSAGIAHAAAEQWTEAPFKDVALRGAIDLVLRDGRGREIVLDVKWGGEPYRGQELEDNAYLQLATYAYMRRKVTAARDWPYHAYFIVSTGNVLAHDASVFPDAVVFAPATDERVDAMWARASATYDWRRAQIAANAIEVNAEGTERELELVAPAEALDTDVDPDGFDEFTWLTGWDEGA